MSSRCPVAREIERQTRGIEGETSDTEEREEVPSQTYWMTVKRWVPW